MKSFSIIILLGLNLASCAGVPSVEYELITNLTSNYDINARPVIDHSDPVHVRMSLAIQQVIDLNEPLQILTTNVFMRVTWNDVALAWNPADYNNITDIRLEVNRIWRPDLTLYNDVSNDRRDIEYLYPAIVEHDGTVLWLALAVFTTSCTLEMRNFPWDKQECIMEFGSWTYDSLGITMGTFLGGGDTSMFIENGEWGLDGMPTEVVSEIYPCCPAPFHTIVFTIKLTRKPMFYVINIVLPCVFVSLVGLLVFILPPTSGEKVSLSVTALLASTVFLLIVADALPPQSNSVPIVSEYFECVIGLLALSTIVTVFIINIHHRDPDYKPPHKLLRIIFLDGIARVVCMHSMVTANVHFDNTPSDEVHPINQVSVEPFTKVIIPTSNGHQNNSSQHIGNGSVAVRDVTLTTNQQHKNSCSEWILIAMVLDRLFLIAFLFVTLVATLAILLNR